MTVRFSAIASLLAIGLFLAGCQTPPLAPPPRLPPMAAPMTAMVRPPPPPPQPAEMDQPNYYRLRNTPAGQIPARVALLLPLSSPSAENRAIAQALEHAAELAVFDAKSSNILLM